MDGIHFLDAAAPAGIRLYAIGDVHGRLDLLQAMHGIIGEQLELNPAGDWRIIHLGDYVDRGPESKGVIDYLIRRTEEEPRILTLAGNHDVGFLQFLNEPDIRGLFANYGGVETAASYGVDADFSDEVKMAFGHAALEHAVPARHIRFLENLQRSVEFGDFYFCHAGIRPGVALDAQSPQDLIWIRETFLDYPHLHPKVIVHGHTPHSEPEILANRVNIDTLAYHSGRLTALEIDGTEKRLLYARE